MTLLFRQAKLADLPALMAIEETCFSTDLISRRQMHYLLTKGKTYTIVATFEEKVIAYAMFLLRSHSKTSRLYSVAVASNFQQQGIAKKLLKESLTHLKEQNYQSCFLETRESHTHTQKLYQSLGFTPISYLKEYYQDKEAALRMKLIIDQSHVI